MFSSWNRPQVVPTVKEHKVSTVHSRHTQNFNNSKSRQQSGGHTSRQISRSNRILSINPTPDTIWLSGRTSRQDLIELLCDKGSIPTSWLGRISNNTADLEASGAKFGDAVTLSVAWLTNLTLGVGFEGDAWDPARDLIVIWTWNTFWTADCAGTGLTLVLGGLLCDLCEEE